MTREGDQPPQFSLLEIQSLKQCQELGTGKVHRVMQIVKVFDSLWWWATELFMLDLKECIKSWPCLSLSVKAFQGMGKFILPFSAGLLAIIIGTE